jgi:hypothetical protein
MRTSFPDGMIVIEGPNLGYMTDTMVWLTSSMRATMALINAEREALGQQHLYLYTDKIFRTDQIAIPAYSVRWGFVQPWMHHLNDIMKKLRVSVEWAFGKVKYLFKSTYLQLASKVMTTEPAGDFILAAFFSNYRTCFQWGGQFRKVFGVVPPSNIDDYLEQP